MRFFFDNNLAPKLAKSLNVLVEPEHHVVHLKDCFAANTPDQTWMLALADEPDWVIISGDVRISKNPHEIQAWETAGHTTFFLKSSWTNISFWDQAQKFVKCFPENYRNGEKCQTWKHVFRYSEWEDQLTAHNTSGRSKNAMRQSLTRDEKSFSKKVILQKGGVDAVTHIPGLFAYKLRLFKTVEC